MTINAHFVTFLSAIPDLKFLATQCRGPDFAKTQITAWVTKVEASCDDAWTLDNLKVACTALVVLAHANAAFRRGKTSCGYRGPAFLEIEDRGGYLVARKLLIEILDISPLCNKCQTELLSHVLHMFRQHRQQLDKLLPEH
jgi:hypothetical protein